MEEGNKTEQIKQMLEERSEKDSTKPVSLGAELDEAKKYYSERLCHNKWLIFDEK